MSKFLGKLLNRASAAARAFREEQSGVAAIEFAFIAPLLITIWLGTMEISQGIEVNKKVGRSASIIGDLIAQELSLPVATIDDIMKIGAAVLQPYNRDAPRVTVTEIHIDAGLNATVVWSRRGDANTFSRPFAPGSAVLNLPANMKIADTDLIRVETQLEYLPVTSWTIRKNATGPSGSYATVNMAETYYMRPRQGSDVKCVGC
jgi:Flp pilus assembly protein TadG